MRIELVIVIGAWLVGAAQDSGARSEPARPLPYPFLGTLKIGDRTPRSAIHGVGKFVVGADGDFVCVRPQEVFVIDGDTGERIGEIPLPRPGFLPRVVLGDGDRVYLTRENRWFAKESIPFMAVDLRTKGVVEVSSSSEGAQAGPVTGIAWLPGGRVATASPNSLRCWTSDGRLEWTLAPSERLETFDEICATSDGRIAVLDRRGESGVQFVDAVGREGPFVSLDPDRAWSGILPAPDGGLWLVGWDRDAMELVRTDGRGLAVESRIPRFPDGARLCGAVAIGPGGEIWITDHDRAFVRIGADGVVDRVVGERREGAPLVEATTVRIGSDDRIYAASARDRAVHVFDPEGNPLYVARPTAHDGGGAPTAGLEGLEWVERRWFPVDGTRLRWEVEDRSVRLVDAVLGEIRRHEEPEASEETFGPAGTSPDGRLAVALSRTKGRREVVRVVLLRTGRAEVERIEAPPGIEWVKSIAFDGERIAIASLAALDVVRLDGKPVARTKLQNDVWRCGNGPDTTFRVDFARRGSELWLRRGDHGTTIERYALP